MKRISLSGLYFARYFLPRAGALTKKRPRDFALVRRNGIPTACNGGRSVVNNWQELLDSDCAVLQFDQRVTDILDLNTKMQ